MADIPASSGKQPPRDPTVPAVRMGRSAVDQAFKAQGLAGALDRASRSDIAAYVLMVDAKDATTAAFHRHHGFIILPDSAMTHFPPLATVLASRKRKKLHSISVISGP